MDIFIGPLFTIINIAIDLFIWVLIISAILSWLIAFNIVNTQNQLVYLIRDFTYRLTEPLLAPIRRMIPDLGGVDLSPIILILILYFIQMVLKNIALSMM